MSRAIQDKFRRAQIIVRSTDLKAYLVKLKLLQFKIKLNISSFLIEDMALPFDLGFQQIILIIGVVLVISFIFFRRYFSALIYDYVVDGLLSFADNFIAGAGLAGLDIADWIAAFLIFKKEKKISGKGVAMLAAWEATNFLPVSLIPVIGEAVEIFFGFFPAVFILRLLFNKYRPAEKQEKKLEKEISIAEQFEIKVSKEKGVLKDVKKLIKKANPVGALKKLKSEKPVKDVSSKLKDYTDSVISDTNNVIQYVVSQNVQAPQEMINMLQEAINEAWQLLQQAQNAEENEDFETAINSAANANNIIRAGAQQFYDAFQQYQNELQQ